MLLAADPRPGRQGLRPQRPPPPELQHRPSSNFLPSSPRAPRTRSKSKRSPRPRARTSARTRDHCRQRTYPHPHSQRPAGLPQPAPAPSYGPSRAPHRQPAMRASRGARVSATVRPLDAAGSAARGSSTAWPRQSQEALGLPLSLDGAAGIVCSAPAGRAGLPDTYERTNAVAALKPRPEWVQGKAESHQLNNHLSSANPPQQAQAREGSQGSKPARTAQPLLGGRRERAARFRPAAQPSVVERGPSSRDRARSTRCLPSWP